MSRWTQVAALKQIASFAQNLVILALLPSVLPDLYREAIDWFNKLTNVFDLETVGPECFAGTFGWDARFGLTMAVLLAPLIITCCCVEGSSGKTQQALLLWCCIGYTTITTLCAKSFQRNERGGFWYEPSTSFTSAGHILAMFWPPSQFMENEPTPPFGLARESLVT